MNKFLFGCLIVSAILLFAAVQNIQNYCAQTGC